MKKIIILVSILFLNGCNVSPEFNNNKSFIDYPANVKNFQNSTVSILIKNENNELVGPVCTGFFISKDLLATAHHCLRLKKELVFDIGDDLSINIDVKTEKAKGKKILISTKKSYDIFKNENSDNRLVYKKATVVEASKENDLALLKVKKYTHSNWISLSKKEVQIGQTVYGMGMPAGQPWILTKGIVSMINKSINDEILHQAPISPGASGSPLIDEDGHLIGVNVGFIKEAAHVGIAIPIKHLKKLIDQYEKQ